ncbi:MAG: lipid-A-disaccharide synthase [Nitrospirota bacterium]
MPKKLMIVAGEASGELYGALLSRAVKKTWPETEIIGIGGNRMKKEGVHLIASISSALGLSETIRHWRQIIGSFKSAKEALTKQRPDILVLIDYPDFNIALAKKAKSAGIPILYYVSPQVWAWRAKRVKKIASLVNKMAVLFPFEVEIYKDAGLPCEFVGHPIAETIDANQTKDVLKRKLGLDPERKVISLLPGSRPAEIDRHESLIKEAAEKIHRELPEMQIVIPIVSGTNLSQECPDYVNVIYDRTSEVVSCSEAIAVASGTATLEAALIGTPMVVFYKLSNLTVFFGKLLLKVKFISLVNILSGKEVVRELIQNDASAGNIFTELKRILTDSEYRQNMVLNLQKISELMGRKTASTRVASMIGELAGWTSTGV